jgi:hypothetical protein
MRATDIIRAVLDLIDGDEQAETTSSCGCGPEEPERITQDDEEARFYSILDMLRAEDDRYIANAPNEVVADVDSVTTLAGGGVNGPKHPDDIRVKDPRGFE